LTLVPHLQAQHPQYKEYSGRHVSEERMESEGRHLTLQSPTVAVRACSNRAAGQRNSINIIASSSTASWLKERRKLFEFWTFCNGKLDILQENK